MVGVLLDTCIVAELQRPRSDPRVDARVAEFDPDLVFLSVITVGEIAKGIALWPAGARRQEFALWLLGLEQSFTSRILPVEIEIARLWGELTAQAQSHGAHVPATDGLIAATALHHGLPVMTRNSRDFVASGVPIINPWDDGT